LQATNFFLQHFFSFDQVYFDRKSGVKLPAFRKGDGSEEEEEVDEEKQDTISFMSLPAVIQGTHLI
jgi:hypothetical protein